MHQTALISPAWQPWERTSIHSQTNLFHTYITARVPHVNRLLDPSCTQAASSLTHSGILWRYRQHGVTIACKDHVAEGIGRSEGALCPTVDFSRGFYSFRLQIQYASVPILRYAQVWPHTTPHSLQWAKQALQGRCWVHPGLTLYR